MADSFRLGGKQLVEFGDLLKVNSKALRLEMRRELEPVRTKLADEMKARADSTKIAATIKSGTRGTGNTVRLVFTAGAPGQPIARLRELGNRGSSPTATTFRHPAWGRWDVKDPERLNQAKHPFMKPTVEAHKDDTPEAMRDAVEKTWRHSQPPDV